MPRSMHSEQTHAAPSTAAAGTGDAEPPQRLWADIVHDGGDWAGVPGVEDAVQAAVNAVAGAAELDVGPSTFCVALSSDAHVAELNGAYRGKNKPTNVLSFPAPVSAGTGNHDETANLGDIVLAAETVLAEARDQGIAPADHLKHLVIHGLLHLLGFDHENDADAEEMEALEILILARLGIANPYADPPEPDAVHVQPD